MPDSIDFLFTVYPRAHAFPSGCKSQAFLVHNTWDDYGFKTLFTLFTFDRNGNRCKLGHVKIGKFGMDEGSTQRELPETFARLSDDYFSLGQDDSYYEELGKLDEEIQGAVLTGLRDIVTNFGLRDQARRESVTTTSLLRSITWKSVEGQYLRLVRGGARLTEYDFTYTAPKRVSRLKLSFAVKPGAFPPANIHVLIGRNGAGKTHILQLMAKALTAKPSAASQSGKFTSSSDAESEGAALFANLVSVSFSAFDDFELIPERGNSADGIGYYYIGLRRPSTSKGDSSRSKSPEMLVQEFVKSSRICTRGAPAARWKKALKALESDPIFKEAEVTALTAANDDDDEESEAKAMKLFKRLSSGHKLVLLTITRLVETVEEQTLVLLDEPESHLHPPLLSAFVRALSDLMINRNGVAIVATHSPFILQEVPKDCVWMLYRTGKNVQAERPEGETFGENVGILTREAFGYEVTDSGFHKMLRDVVSEGLTFTQATHRFHNKLGAEARAILRGLCASRDSLS